MKQLEGLSNVLKNLNKEILKLEANVKVGLTEAALVVKADAVRQTPIDLGNLRGSAFIMVTDGHADSSGNFTGPAAGSLSGYHGKAISEAKGLVSKGRGISSAVIAYSANYAFWVHEMPAHYNFNSGNNQFLRNAIQKNRTRILQILAKWAKH